MHDDILHIILIHLLTPLLQLVTLGCELAMVFGGVVPYIPQYLQIKQKQTTQVIFLLTQPLFPKYTKFTFTPSNPDTLTNHHPQGFSLHVCLALLLANTLRIIFWFGKHYETPLLVQSVLMNIAMFALIHLCVTINNKVSCSDGVSGNKINIQLNVLFFPASAVSWWNWWYGGIE